MGDGVLEKASRDWASEEEGDEGESDRLGWDVGQPPEAGTATNREKLPHFKYFLMHMTPLGSRAPAYSSHPAGITRLSKGWSQEVIDSPP